ARDISQIDALMAALAHLRRAEQELSEASLRYMRLGQTDMRALHFLIVCENTGTLATPGAIAQTLGISSASTTKLLDRLEAAGPRAEAMRPGGAPEARRVDAARGLLPAEREIVTGFLRDVAELISVEGAAEGADRDGGEDAGATG